MGVAHDGSGVVVEVRNDPHTLRVRGQPQGIDGVLDDVGQLHRLHVEAKLSADDARDVEQILDELG